MENTNNEQITIINNINNEKVKKKMGRPARTLNFPMGEFTAKSLLEDNKGLISISNMHYRINKALNSGQIKFVGLLKTARRSARIYNIV